MKVVWKQGTLGALLLLGSVAAAMEKKRSGGIGSSRGVSQLDCDDVDNVGSQNQAMNRQPQFMDRINYFFDLDEEVKTTADNDHIEVKTNGVDERSVSLPRRLVNIFRHYYSPSPPTPELARDRPTRSSETSLPEGGTVHRHYWPLPTDPAEQAGARESEDPLPVTVHRHPWSSLSSGAETPDSIQSTRTTSAALSLIGERTTTPTSSSSIEERTTTATPSTTTKISSSTTKITTTAIPSVTTSTSKPEKGRKKRKQFETQFEARVLIQYSGSPYDLDEHEKQVLADSFLDNYNELGDDIQRNDLTITNVRIIEDLVGGDHSIPSRGRRLESAIETYIDFTKLLGITGTCKGCEDNTRLFGEDRRLEESVHSSNQQSHHFLREYTHHVVAAGRCRGCISPRLFADAYDDDVASLRDEGIIKNVDHVEGPPVQRVPVNCSNDRTEFETIEYVTFNTSIELSDDEMEVLEMSFVEAYNQANALNKDVCDPLFRVAKTAKISRADGNVNRKLESTGGYAYNVTTVCYCRGCSRDDHLFADSSVRRRRRGPVSSKGASNERQDQMNHDTRVDYGKRELQNTDSGCFCPIGEPEVRPPTKAEFQEVYSNYVASTGRCRGCVDGSLLFSG